MKILRVLAIALIAALVVFTIVPANDRPVTGIQHDLEHFGAFLLPGFLFGISFDVKTRVLLLAAIAFTVTLECIQIPLPTRHARIEDVVVDSLALCAGILMARLGRSYLRFQS